MRAKIKRINLKKIEEELSAGATRRSVSGANGFALRTFENWMSRGRVVHDEVTAAAEAEGEVPPTNIKGVERLLEKIGGDVGDLDAEWPYFQFYEVVTRAEAVAEVKNTRAISDATAPRRRTKMKIEVPISKNLDKLAEENGLGKRPSVEKMDDLLGWLMAVSEIAEAETRVSFENWTEKPDWRAAAYLNEKRRPGDWGKDVKEDVEFVPEEDFRIL